jgi:hypothetical protein
MRWMEPLTKPCSRPFVTEREAQLEPGLQPHTAESYSQRRRESNGLSVQKNCCSLFKEEARSTMGFQGSLHLLAVL